MRDETKCDPIDCETFEDRVHQLLDQRQPLTNDKSLMVHASQCAPCDEMLSDFHSVDDSIKLLKEDIAQILEQADAKREKTGFPSFAYRPINVLVALSAMVVFCVGVFHLFNPQDTTPNFLVSKSVKSVPSVVVPIKHDVVIPEIVQNATTEEKTKLNDLIIRTANFRLVPDAIYFDSDFSITSSFSVPKTIPGFPSVPQVPTWRQISSQLEPLEPVLMRSSQLPGFGPVSYSFNTTINLLKQSFSKNDEGNQDLGCWIDPRFLAMA